MSQTVLFPRDIVNIIIHRKRNCSVCYNLHTGVAGPRLLDNYYWSDSNVFKNCKVVCMEMLGLQRKGSLRPQRKLKVGLEFPPFQYPNKAIKGDTLFFYCT